MTGHAYRAWELTVGPEERTHTVRDEHAPFDLLATDLRAIVPMDLTPEERRAALETVWLALALNERPMLKVPLFHLLGSAGPYPFATHQPYFGDVALLVRGNDRVAVTLTYDPESWVNDSENPQPRPALLTRPIAVHVSIAGIDVLSTATAAGSAPEEP